MKYQFLVEIKTPEKIRLHPDLVKEVKNEIQGFLEYESFNGVWLEVKVKEVK